MSSSSALLSRRVMQLIHAVGLFCVVLALYIWHGDELIKALGTVKEREEYSTSSSSSVVNDPNSTALPVPLTQPVTTTNVTTTTTTTSQWCPKADCRQQRLCETCSRRFLIVIAQGRSASTSLIEMLDLLPNVRMGGENERIVARFHEMREILEQTPYGNENRGSAWKHNPVEPEDWICPLQNLIETIYPPKQGEPDEGVILGFKTIRFAFSNREFFNVSKNVELYKAMFPCARFLINIRSDTNALVSSRKKAFYVNEELEKSNSKKEISMLKQSAEMFGKQQAMLLDSTQWTKNVSLLNEAVSWLGFHETCHFQALLEFNTADSYTPTKSHLDNRDTRCHYVG